LILIIKISYQPGADVENDMKGKDYKKLQYG